MNLSIEEKLELIRQMKNLPQNSKEEKKKEQKKRDVAFFFLRLSAGLCIAGFLYICILRNESMREVLYVFFTEESKVNLIDFFALFKYTFKGL